MFEKMKEKRKARIEKKDPYLEHEIILRKKLAQLTPCTDEYKETQQELKTLIQIRSESKESKRKISKSDRGGIIIRVLELFGAGAGVTAIVMAEKNGMIFTGEKKRIMDTVSSCVGKLFFHH